MSAYMGTMPWLILWLGIPWIGSGVTLLGNPNVLYSRRVLGWSVACFLALSAGLWWINPALFMTDQVAGGSTYDTTRGTIAIGMIFSAIMFLFTWPDGKTAKGLALLGSVLGIMVGVRLGIPQEMYTQLRNGLSPSLFDFIRIVIPSLGGILWVMSIPYLTKKNTDAFDQAPLFEKFMYFMRWLLLLLPTIIFIFFDHTFFKTYLMDQIPDKGMVIREDLVSYFSFFGAFIALFLAVSFMFIPLQSWRIPGFWRNAGMVFLTPFMYFVNRKYTYSPPLTSDKTALCPGALPEQIALWNPWSIMNRGMIWLFWSIFWTLSFLMEIPTNTLPVPKLFMMCYINIGIIMMMVLHAYALFQPRFVPYRFLLWCSMVGLWFYSFALNKELFMQSINMNPSIKLPSGVIIFIGLIGVVCSLISFVITLLPMIRAYKYRAILNPDGSDVSSTPALSRFWVLCLLGASLSIVLYSLYGSV